MPAPDLSDASIPELVSLQGRVAVVTGAVNGTGAGIARRLSEAGAVVVITHADPAVAAEAANGLAPGDRPIHGLGLDVNDERSFAALGARVEADHGTIGIWVNNAGIYPGSGLLEMTAEDWDEVMDHNLRSAFLGSKIAAGQMIATGSGGVIVNIGSISSFRAPYPGMSHYIASKFGLRGLTQALAVELGPHQIRVLGVAPTFTVTEGTRARRSDLDDEAYEAYLDRIGARKPLGRVAVPDDVARVVLFGVSDLAACMTGTTLPVDAGDLA